MTCNCNCMQDDTTILIIRGTSISLTFMFNVDISTYNSAIFTIRKNYETAPVITKTITGFTDKTLDVELTPAETALFTEFLNGKNSTQYIWGLDLVDTENNVIVNVFPQTGEPAPLCIVFKNVVEV